MSRTIQRIPLWHFYWSVLALFCLSWPASCKQIAVITNLNFSGEKAFAYRIQRACRNIGWTADLFQRESIGNFTAKQYDFAICLVAGDYTFLKCPKYLAVFAPLPRMFKSKLVLKDNLCSFDGYLLTIPLPDGPEKGSFTNKESLEWYPTAYQREYREVDPVFLFQTCATWGNRASNAKFRQLYQLLDQEPYVRFYGKETVAKRCPRSYQGAIPFDEESLYEIASQAGISLLIHSSRHNQCGIPSGRIFEAAAASTVIISDQNAFVQKHFGDSVLYIDTTQNAHCILDQIRAHMQWIYNNKPAALQKAKRAHEIFTEKFLLEEQLLRLEEFHNRIKT